MTMKTKQGGIQMKRYITVFLALMMLFSVLQVPAQAAWQQVGGKWYYKNEAGENVTGWLQAGGKWYYLKPTGEMATGWQQVGGKWYYLKASGEMATGWQQVGGKWYYLKASGEMATGWQQVGGKWYYLKASGEMATGWQQVGGKWYYLKATGEMATGWLKLGNDWYYLMPTGERVSSHNEYTFIRVTIDGKTHEFNYRGVWQKEVVKKWVYAGGKWYYMEDAFYSVGWHNIDGKDYYFDKTTGAMQTGWLKLDGEWHYLTSSGAAGRGWLYYGNQWYYLKRQGKVTTGWLSVNGDWYYFYDSGVMAANTVIEGLILDENGRVQNLGQYDGYEITEKNLTVGYICRDGQELVAKLYGAEDRPYQEGESITLQVKMTHGTPQNLQIEEAHNCTAVVDGDRVTITFRYERGNPNGWVSFEGTNSRGEPFRDGYSFDLAGAEDITKSSVSMLQGFQAYGQRKGMQLDFLAQTMERDRIDNLRMENNPDWIDDVLDVLDEYVQTGVTTFFCYVFDFGLIEIYGEYGNQ